MRVSQVYHGRRCQGIALLAALSLTTCTESTGPTGAAAIPLAGTYTATFTVSLTNAIESRQASEPGTITLLVQGSSGDFAGSYSLEDGSSGVLDGMIDADAGITIVAFGQPFRLTLANLRFVQTPFPNCNWSGSALNEFSGSVSGASLTLVAVGTIACTYNVSGRPAVIPTSLSLEISGMRT